MINSNDVLIILVLYYVVLFYHSICPAHEVSYYYNILMMEPWSLLIGFAANKRNNLNIDLGSLICSPICSLITQNTIGYSRTVLHKHPYVLAL